MALVLTTTIGNLPNIINSLSVVGNLTTMNYLNQTITSNGLTSYSISLSEGTYLITYNCQISQSTTVGQMFRSMQGCFATTNNVINNDITYSNIDFVNPITITTTTEVLNFKNTFPLVISSNSTYYLTIESNVGGGTTFNLNIYITATRII
jgi:hypothetical protein